MSTSTRPYRVMHLSDLHFGATFDASLWDYIGALAARERPNLIAITGDLVDHGGLFMLAAMIGLWPAAFKRRELRRASPAD